MPLKSLPTATAVCGQPWKTSTAYWYACPQVFVECMQSSAIFVPCGFVTFTPRLSVSWTSSFSMTATMPPRAARRLSCVRVRIRSCAPSLPPNAVSCSSWKMAWLATSG